MDAASLVLGIALASAGGGTLALLRSTKKKSTYECPCGHGVNFHKNGVGKCLVIVDRVPIRWEQTALGGRGKPVGWEERPCACQLYAGPELIRSLADLDRLGLGGKEDKYDA